MICRTLVIFLLLPSIRADANGSWACAPPEQDCKSVFIVYSGWHAAIVLHAGDILPDALPELIDFPNAKFMEFSWGDKDYFPNPHAGFFAAIKAAFRSSGSVLHVVGFTTDPRHFYSGAEMVKLSLSPPAYARLLDYISGTFARLAMHSRAEASPGLFAYSRFYSATRKFSLLKTCNAWVAEALEAAGLPIDSGSVMTAGQLAEQSAKSTSSDRSIYFVHRKRSKAVPELPLTALFCAAFTTN